MEITYFIQATEDLEKVSKTVIEKFGLPTDEEREQLSGHFGNTIIRVILNLSGKAATSAFGKLVAFLGSDRTRELLRDMELATDDHGALYIRLDKQDFLRGRAVFGATDPLRIRVRARGYLVDRDLRQIYGELMGQEGN